VRRQRTLFGDPPLWPNNPGEAEGVPVAIVEGLPGLPTVVTDIRAVGSGGNPDGINVISHSGGVRQYLDRRPVPFRRSRGGCPSSAAFIPVSRSPAALIWPRIVAAYCHGMMDPFISVKDSERECAR